VLDHRTTRGAGRVLAPLLILLLVLAAPAARADQRTAGMLEAFNTERALNELPLVGEVNAQQEAGCANHLSYMALNGGALVHGEEPARAGYTPEGNFENGAGGSEVLSAAPGWRLGANPWATAPIHLYLMFNPAVVSTGYADDERFACQRMAERHVQSAPLTFYAWTGANGRIGVPTATTAREAPYTPQQLVGIPDGQATGPNLMVFSAGNLGVVRAAGLTGPTGPVAVKLVNEQTRSAAGSGSWFRGGAVIIPTAPLAPQATYTATVLWSDQGQAAKQQFAFKTGGSVRPALDVALRLGARHDGGVTLTVPPPAIGRAAALRVLARGYDRRRVIVLQASQRIRLPRISGGKRVTVRLGPFAAGEQPYRATKVTRRYR
jgi:hypothetical protein